MGWRLISCVVLAAVLTACQPASVSVAGNVVSATNPLVCLVIADSLHVREGPGVEYPVAGYIHYGTIVDVVAQVQAADGGTWVQIDAGWVNRRWLECTNQKRMVK